MIDLVIPDIHHKWRKAEEIIKWAEKEYGSDMGHIYFLGDYFDDWHDGPHHARATAGWLVESCKDPRRTHLIGNHDAPYMLNTVVETLNIRDHDEIDKFSQKYMSICGCSGWDVSKHRAVNLVEGIEDAFRSLKTVVRYNDYLVLSHAGCAQKHKDCDENEFWDVLTNDACGLFGDLERVAGAGFSRGGSIPTPGPLWLDFHADRDAFCGDFNQIVGHTQGKTIREFRRGTSQHVCLDTRMEHFATLDQGSDITVMDVLEPKEFSMTHQYRFMRLE